MDYKISECFAALTGFRAFVEEMLVKQRQQLEAEIAALKAELERVRVRGVKIADLKAEVTALKESATVQAASAASAEITTLKAELQESYGCGARTCTSKGCYGLGRLEIAGLSVQAGRLLDTAHSKEELATMILKMGDIARFGCDSGHY